MKARLPTKTRSWYEIQLNPAQTRRYETDPDYQYEISEVCAITLAEHGWVGNEVRVVGSGPGGTRYLTRFRYDA